MDTVIAASAPTSLQAALDALPAHGGTIRIPAGTYSLPATLTARLSAGQHLVLEGEGRGSVLRNDRSDGTPLMHLTGVVGSWWPDLRLTLRNLALVGNPDSGPALVMDYPNDALVDSCAFLGHGAEAIMLGPQGTNVTVRDCWLRDCRRGIRADNIHHLTLHGNQTRSLRDGQTQEWHLFLDWQCREVRVIGNHFAYGQAQGIVLDGTAQHVLSGNTIEGFAVGIEARGKGETNPPDHCRDMVISGNYLHADTGILLRGQCRAFVIQGNNIINNPQGAVVLVDASAGGGHSITGNVIRKSVYDGVYVKTASPLQGGIDLGEAINCVVSGNVLEEVNAGAAVKACSAGHLVSGNLIARGEGPVFDLPKGDGAAMAANRVNR